MRKSRSKKGRLCTIVSFRVRTTGSCHVALVRLAEGENPDAAQAGDMIAALADQAGCPAADIELLGQWAKRQMRETS